MTDEQSETSRPVSRRRFVTLGVTGACAVGVGATTSWLMTREGGNEQGLGERFNYDLRGIARTDPKLLRYDALGPVEQGFINAHDMTSDGEVILIAHDKSIVQLDDKTATPVAGTPRCVARSADGRLFVGLSDHVEIYSPGGDQLAAWSPFAGQPHITSIALSDKWVFIADAGNRAVWRCDHDGNVDGRINGFVIPSPFFDLAIDGETLWVANTGKHRLEAYALDGTLLRMWGSHGMAAGGFCGCCNPAQFVLMPDGRFITCEKGFNRVSLFSADGEFEGLVAGHEALGMPVAKMTCDMTDRANTPPIAALDAQGRVFVLNPVTGDIHAFTPKSA
jgi:hypothetical protein